MSRYKESALIGLGPFEGLLSLAEAAEMWDIDPSTIRKAILDHRLVEGKDCRKFGKQWVVSEDAMHRVFDARRTLRSIQSKISYQREIIRKIRSIEDDYPV